MGRRGHNPVHAKWGPAAVLILAIGAPLLAQEGLGRARQMLRELDQERSDAAQKHREMTVSHMRLKLVPIQRVVNDAILSLLNRPSPISSSELEKMLRRALGLEGEDSQVASGFSFGAPSGRPTYVVAYSLAAAITTSRSWVGVFGPEGPAGQYRLLADVGDSLPDKTIVLLPLGLRRGRSAMFLAYGINWGDAHNRLTVIAYSFDSRELKPIWSRADLPQGQVKVEGGKIELTFLSSLLGPGYKSVHSITEIYRVTSSGISLERRSAGPRS